MMITTFDRFMFTQVGLDSAALTMLGTVVHTPRVPGQYRGTVRAGGLPEATFYVSVDPQCAVAQVNIDLASLMAPASATTQAAGDCGCGSGDGEAGGSPRFVVHPKGYIVFHVSGGAGGYSVNLRRAEEDVEHKAYDTRQLQAGDIFAAVVIRPGTYAMKNLVSGAQGELTVAYPVIGKTAFKPPPALHVDCGKTFEPRAVHLLPSQGLNVHVLEAAHLKIELLRADDGPGNAPPGTRGGWKKTRLPAES
jgi:hypothetical protein